MSDPKSSVKLGDGVADALVQTTNQEVIDCGKLLLAKCFQTLKEQINNIDVEAIFSKKKQEDVLRQWSDELAEKGLISNGYKGLSTSDLIHNLRQEGYLDGLFAGYAFAMMSLVDNGAEEELIVSVRDDMRATFIGHSYNDNKELLKELKNDKYSWIDKLSREDSTSQ